MAEFTGFSRETYDFLTELALNNESAWFQPNRPRYIKHVKEPMYTLAAALLPTALEIDPGFNTKLSTIVSRINRDTRFSKDKSPYRDHAWLGFRYPDMRLSECYVLYFEINPGNYGYGMGMYHSNTAIMTEIRKRIQANPARFLSLANGLVRAGLTLEGESYSHNRFKDANESIQPYLNKRTMGWHFSSTKLKDTMRPELLDEVRTAFMRLKEMYRFINGIEQKL